jgi:hypothetical protein
VPRKTESAAAPSRAPARRAPARDSAAAFAAAFKERTGFAPYDRFLDALSSVRELPGAYPTALTVAERRKALQEVDGGRLQRAAALTREACTEWGDLFGVLSSVTEVMAGLPQLWQGPEELVEVLRGTPDRPGIADILVPETERASVVKAGITLGVGLGRLSRVDVMGTPMRRLAHWDSEHLGYHWSDDTWWVNTSQGPQWIDPHDDDGEWVLFLPYGEKYPWKKAPWKAITLAYTLARDSWFQRARYGQVIAPTRVGKTSTESSEEHRQVFASLLANAVFDNWMLLRPGEEYEVKGVSGGDNTLAVFEQADAWARRTIVTAIKGETVTTDGSAGFNAGSVQERMSGAKLAFYARAVSRFEARIFSWAAHDLDGRHAHVARTYDTRTPGDAAAKIKAIEDAGKAIASIVAGAKEVGLRPKAQSIRALIESVGVEVEPMHAESQDAIS